MPADDEALARSEAERQVRDVMREAAEEEALARSEAERQVRDVMREAARELVKVMRVTILLSIVVAAVLVALLCWFDFAGFSAGCIVLVIPATLCIHLWRRQVLEEYHERVLTLGSSLGLRLMDLYGLAKVEGVPELFE